MRPIYGEIILLLIFLTLIFSPPIFAAFNITDISPIEINGPDDVVVLEASGSGLASGKTEYLQVGITKEGETPNYFGYTKNLDDQWIVYKSSPDELTRSTFYRFIPVDGSWSGKIKFKIDPQDSGFKGTGNYLVKLLRYITSSSANDSNSVSLKVNYSKPVPAQPSQPENNQPAQDSVQTSSSDSQEITITSLGSTKTVTKPTILGAKTKVASSEGFEATVNLGIVRTSSPSMDGVEVRGKNESISKEENSKQGGLDLKFFLIPAVGLGLIALGLLKYAYVIIQQRRF